MRPPIGWSYGKSGPGHALYAELLKRSGSRRFISEISKLISYISNNRGLLIALSARWMQMERRTWNNYYIENITFLRYYGSVGAKMNKTWTWSALALNPP
ncbi:hypothetical protein AVEN_9668-1 [Araneus ventricosus]|uniref:Uncharacterized protein n=1 Tax=Araneus ventricosus TaxID=182803 RepID=A0A4Y2KNZ7_ARAVE|nr:hypothetical protein AVEN_9668-1 [Araneus ventricosus]